MNDEIKEILDFKENADYKRLSCDEIKILLDYITNLEQEKEDYKSRVEKAVEYITSYEAISTIQGLDRTEQNKTLDERTMNVMVERYLQVHHNLLNILQNGSDEE